MITYIHASYFCQNGSFGMVPAEVHDYDPKTVCQSLTEHIKTKYTNGVDVVLLSVTVLPPAAPATA